MRKAGSGTARVWSSLPQVTIRGQRVNRAPTFGKAALCATSTGPYIAIDLALKTS